MSRIIVVEDDLAQQEEILSYLAHLGHEVVGVASGSELGLCLERFSPEIVLLDYNLPGENGPVLAERLRAKFGLELGIIMITARGLSTDRIECRRAGADDYLVKPIAFDEMLITIDNLLLRIKSSPLTTQAWKLMPTHATLISPDGVPIALMRSEVLLLTALANGEIGKVSREDLIRSLGKSPDYYDSRALETAISRLRRKLPVLEDGRNPLQSLRNIGYQFIRPLQIIV